MPVVGADKLAKLQQNADDVRNVKYLAHFENKIKIEADQNPRFASWPMSYAFPLPLFYF